MNPTKSILLLLIVICNMTADVCFAQNAERIKIIFGTRSHRLEDGCGGDKGLCFIITNTGKPLEENEGIAEISLVDNQVLLNILEDVSPAESDENIFYVFAPKEIPAEACIELGVDKIRIQPGEYRLNKNKNPLGSVLLRAEMK